MKLIEYLLEDTLEDSIHTICFKHKQEYSFNQLINLVDTYEHVDSSDLMNIRKKKGSELSVKYCNAFTPEKYTALNDKSMILYNIHKDVCFFNLNAIKQSLQRDKEGLASFQYIDQDEEEFFLIIS